MTEIQIPTIEEEKAFEAYAERINRLYTDRVWNNILSKMTLEAHHE